MVATTQGYSVAPASHNGVFSADRSLGDGPGASPYVGILGDNYDTTIRFKASGSARTANVTHGKQKGVKYIIKVL